MRYATCTTWAEYFREEDLQIGEAAIIRRLNDAGIVGKDGRIKIGRVLNGAYFSESDVRSVCTDLLNNNLLKSDKSGFFIKDGIKYGTIGGWVETLQILRAEVKRRVKKFQVNPVKGKNTQGRISNFYSETDIRSSCASLLKILPDADKFGFFKKESVLYGTIFAWSRVLPISRNAIRGNIKKHKIDSIKGRDTCRRLINLYSEYDVRSACADLLNLDLPQADKTGFFEENGMRYGTVVSWSRALPISTPSINKYLQDHKVKFIKGKDYGGRVVNFFSESNVRKACKKLLNLDLPQADKSGFFEREGIKYGIASGWSRIFGTSICTTLIYLRKSNVNSIKGKDSKGRVLDFYPESTVRSACANLLDPGLPQVDKSGIFEIDGERYGTIHYWSKIIPISHSAIKKHIHKARINSIKGKSKTRITNFYSEPDIRSACADILAKRENPNPHAA